MARTGRPAMFNSHCDILGYLRDTGRAMESYEISDRVGYALQHTWRVLADLHECGLIHIAAWRSVTIGGGHPAKIWAYGYGIDAKKPKAKDVVTVRRASWRRRYQETKKKYGSAIATKIHCSIKNGGADRVVIDGKTIYERKRRSITTGEMK